VNSVVTVRMKAARFFETLGTNDPITRRGDPEDLLAQYSRSDPLNRFLLIARNIFIYIFIFDYIIFLIPCVFMRDCFCIKK
jgi:hypothetical protein